MAYIIYISGGQRSGKSRYAQDLAQSLSTKPIYLATSRIWDDDFRKRVERHQNDRDERWTTIEEEKFLSHHKLEGRVVLVDCIMLWITNLFYDNDSDIDKTLEQARKEWDAFTSTNVTIIAVSNEIGMGLHAETEVGRKFTDVLGFINQYIARKANKAYFMVSGIPLTIKE